MTSRPLGGLVSTSPPPPPRTLGSSRLGVRGAAGAHDYGASTSVGHGASTPAGRSHTEGGVPPLEGPDLTGTDSSSEVATPESFVFSRGW